MICGQFRDMEPRFVPTLDARDTQLKVQTLAHLDHGPSCSVTACNVRDASVYVLFRA